MSTFTRGSFLVATVPGGLCLVVCVKYSNPLSIATSGDVDTCFKLAFFIFPFLPLMQGEQYNILSTITAVESDWQSILLQQGP